MYSTGDTPAMMISPLFLELFSTHLAAGLIGSVPLIKKLEENSSTNIYWRTPLIDRPEISDKCTPEFYCVILDVRISFSRKESTGESCIKLEFGTILAKSGSSTLYFYVKGIPFTISDLRENAEEIGVDIESTPPKAMATSMCDALLALRKIEPISMSMVNGKIMVVRIPIFYADLEETGTLVVKVETTSTLDSPTSSMLLFNFFEQDSLRRHEIEAKQDNDLVAAAFVKWWTVLPINLPANVSKESSERNSIIALTSVSEMHPGQRQLPAKSAKTGYSRIAKKRKKPGMLTYANDSNPS